MCPDQKVASISKAQLSSREEAASYTEQLLDNLIHARMKRDNQRMEQRKAHVARRRHWLQQEGWPEKPLCFVRLIGHRQLTTTTF